MTQRIIVRGLGIGPAGADGVDGIDGTNVAPTDTFIAGRINDPASETAVALSATYAHVEGGELVIDGTPVGGAVDSVNGLTGDIDLPNVATAFIGQVNGAPIQPAKTPPPLDLELWTLTNFRAGFNTTTLTPSITANGTTQQIRTLISLGNCANRDRTFRLRLPITSIPSNGWGQVLLQVVDSTGTIIAGTNKQSVTIISMADLGLSSLDTEFDFKVGPWGDTGSVWLEVRLDVLNNATTGTLAIGAGASLRETGAVQRPMMFGAGIGIPPTLHVPLFDPRNDTWRMASHTFSPTGADYLSDVTGYNTDRPFRYDPPDPDFAGPYADTTTYVGASEILLTTGQRGRSLHLGNNDQILSVMKADGSYELRGNIHGGESLRTAAVMEYDAHGDGTWTAWDGTGGYLRTARKFRMRFNTKLTRSAPDSNDFANVDHTATYFPDGMMRMDRTTTFTAAARLGQVFEWMTSHDTAVPHVGRIGSGLIVLDEVDVFPKLATPAAPAVVGSTSGGAMPAGTRYYATTELSNGGETNPSPVTAVSNTGTTSSNALTLAAAPTGTIARRVYVGASPNTLALVATLTPATTTWTDDGTAPAVGTQPPRTNQARLLDATTTDFDWAVSDQASWAVWYDPILNLCWANIFDRDSIAQRAGVRSVKTRLGRGAGIKKNYINIYFDSDGLGAATDEVATRAFPSGTVWSATHWSYAYVPSDPTNYHLEVAARAASLDTMKDIYPA